MYTQSHLLLVSQVFLAMANWALLSLIARFFPPELTGEYGLSLAVLSPIFLLFSLQLRNHYLSLPTEQLNQDKSPCTYLSLRLISITPIIICSIFASNFIQTDRALLMSLLFFKASEYFFEIPFMLEHKKGELFNAASKHILRTLLVYSVLLISLFTTNQLQTAFFWGGSSGMIIFFYYLFNQKIKIQKSSFNIHHIKHLVQSTLPLGIAACVTSLNVSLPRFYIAEMIDKKAVAAFTLIFTIYAIWQLIFNSYLNAVLPRFTALNRKEKLLAPLSCFTLFTLILLFYAESFYQALFGQHYIFLAQYNLGLTLAIGLSLLNSYLFYTLLAHNNYTIHMYINIFSLLTNTLLLYPLVKYFGMIGGLYAWIIALIVQIFLYLFQSRLKRCP